MSTSRKSPFDKTVQTICAALVAVKGIFWLWFGWLAAGKLVILAGKPGAGKTSLAMKLAAILSRGSIGGLFWPDGSFAPRGHVIICSSEDGYEDTLLPRLIANGADLNLIHFLRFTTENGRSRDFNFQADLEAFCREIERIGLVLLIIIDPILMAVPGDSNKNSDVRKAFEPLVELAERHNLAILGISHVVKAAKGKDPLNSVAGSLAIGAVARIVMITARTKTPEASEGPASCVVVRAKSNIAADDGGFAYDIEPVTLNNNQVEIKTARITFHEEPLAGTATQILREADGDLLPEKASRVNEARDFLAMILANGPMLATTVESEAASRGISPAALKRAKQEMGIPSRKQVGGPNAKRSLWSLPSMTADGSMPPAFGTWSAPIPNLAAMSAPGATGSSGASGSPGTMFGVGATSSGGAMGATMQTVISGLPEIAGATGASCSSGATVVISTPSHPAKVPIDRTLTDAEGDQEYASRVQPQDVGSGPGECAGSRAGNSGYSGFDTYIRGTIAGRCTEALAAYLKAEPSADDDDVLDKIEEIACCELSTIFETVDEEMTVEEMHRCTKTLEQTQWWLRIAA